MSEQEELILEDKLTRGLAWSYEKMLCEKASRNEEVLISQGGTIRAVLAKEVLETYLRKKPWIKPSATAPSTVPPTAPPTKANVNYD